MSTARPLLVPNFRGPDSLLLLARICDRCARQIEANLRSVYAGKASAVPADLLAGYPAGAQSALVQLWPEKRLTHTAGELARAFRRLQRAAIHEAFALTEE